MPLIESTYTQGVKLCSQCRIIVLVGSCDTFKGVILDRGVYTLKKCHISSFYVFGDRF